jgi:hypothetical protein
LLGLVTLGFQLERVSAQAKPESAQHQAITIEQVNRWETELSNWGRWGKDGNSWSPRSSPGFLAERPHRSMRLQHSRPRRIANDFRAFGER